MFIEYLLTKKADLLFDIFLIFITVIITYWYTEESNFIYYLNALTTEIKGNISQLSEKEFNKTLDKLLARQSTWLAKGISIRVASGTDEGYLYQYLLDHAYTIFVTKGYVIKLQKHKYVKGGIFDNLAEFYLNCIHFNRDSFVHEKNIVKKLGFSDSINSFDPDLIALKQLREKYFEKLNEKMDLDSINYLESVTWDFQGIRLAILLPLIVILLILFS